MCSKLPDIESLPPIAAIFSSRCAQNAPNSAPRGLPQRLESPVIRSKYSCSVSQQFSRLPPADMTFATLSITAYIAPKNGLFSIRYGSMPYAISVAVLGRLSRHGTSAHIA